MHLYALVLCIWTCCIVWALAQERLTAHSYGTGAAAERFTHTQVLNLASTATAAICAAAVVTCCTRSGWRAPGARLLPFLGVSLAHVCGSPIGYASIRYLPYPFFTLATAAKLVPVMTVGKLVYGKRYSKSDVATAACMVAGVAMYSAATHTAAAPRMAAPADATRYGLDAILPSASSLSASARTALGLTLLGVNLTLDGFMTNGQDSIVATQALHPFVMMAILNICSSLLISVSLILDWAVHREASTLLTAASFAARHPEMLMHMAAFGIAAALSQLFIYVCITTYGSFVTTAVTISRKFFSLLLSVAVFGHALSLHQWAAILVVFGGLALQSLSKNPGDHNPSRRTPKRVEARRARSSASPRSRTDGSRAAADDALGARVAATGPVSREPAVAHALPRDDAPSRPARDAAADAEPQPVGAHPLAGGSDTVAAPTTCAPQVHRRSRGSDATPDSSDADLGTGPRPSASYTSVHGRFAPALSSGTASPGWQIAGLLNREPPSPLRLDAADSDQDAASPEDSGPRRRVPIGKR